MCSTRVAGAGVGAASTTKLPPGNTARYVTPAVSGNRGWKPRVLPCKPFSTEYSPSIGVSAPATYTARTESQPAAGGSSPILPFQPTSVKTPFLNSTWVSCAKTATPTRKRMAAIALRKRNRAQVHRAIGFREDQSLRVVERRETRDAGEAGDDLIRNACNVARCGDWFVGLEMVGRDLHHTTRAVGHQNVIVIVLLVSNHVDGPVVRAEFGNRIARYLGSAL